MKKFIIAVIAMMVAVGANAQSFATGLKIQNVFGEKAVTPMGQFSYEFTAGIFSFETSFSGGVTLTSYSTTRNTSATREETFRILHLLALDFDLYAKLHLSRFQIIGGIGYTLHQAASDVISYHSTGFCPYTPARGGYNPDFHSVSGFKASAGLGFSLYQDEYTNRRIDLKVLANFMPCRVNAQKMLKPGLEVGIVFYGHTWFYRRYYR